MSVIFEWFEQFVGTHDVDVVIKRNEGKVVAGAEPWSVGMQWGSEAPGSPMVGAAAYGMGYTLEEALTEACRDCGFHPGVTRMTHGRHCVCSACAAEDWTKITSPCGMHGESCPAKYMPVNVPLGNFV